jgi:single-stranded-DNA-specific exonuclease
MDSTLTLDTIKQILQTRRQNDQYTQLKQIPHPNQLKDMEKATKRIIQAINSYEIINIVGDYDVDGVVSTAIMVNFFQAIDVDVNYIIPNRFEHGYGLSPKILDQIDGGIIITVDNGISAYEAATICKQRGLDLIITDHHTVGHMLPEAYAIVNPKQEDCEFPFKDICGAHVAWYLCASLKKALGVEYNLMDLLDLLVLAIVADIMPMVCLNRLMVQNGLKALEHSSRPAIVALKERFAFNTITEEDIGFKIAPLINCAGRMSDPMVALEFLLSFDLYEAHSGLEYLVELNELRKAEQLQMFEEAKLQVDDSKEVIVVASENWNEGIIGIVASKLCDKYKKPSFVLSINADKVKASARSIESINLYNLIEKSSSVLVGFGGHKQAAGLSLERKNIAKFRELLEQNISFIDHKKKIIDDSIGKFSIEGINENLYELVETYRPYGISNPYPYFRFENLRVNEVNKIGKNKEYSKLLLSDGYHLIEMLVFVDVDEISIGEKISFIASINKNEFRNEKSYNLMLKELIVA